MPVNLQQLAHSKPQLATRAFYLWNNQVALQCEKQGITLATGDRRIHVAVMMPDLGRRPSDHDCLTILFNGLYNCGRVKAREVHPRRFRIHFEGLNWRCHDDSQTIVTMEDEG